MPIKYKDLSAIGKNKVLMSHLGSGLSGAALGSAVNVAPAMTHNTNKKKKKFFTGAAIGGTLGLLTGNISYRGKMNSINRQLDELANMAGKTSTKATGAIKANEELLAQQAVQADAFNKEFKQYFGTTIKPHLKDIGFEEYSSINAAKSNMQAYADVIDKSTKSALDFNMPSKRTSIYTRYHQDASQIKDNVAKYKHLQPKNKVYESMNTQAANQGIYEKTYQNMRGSAYNPDKNIHDSWFGGEPFGYSTKSPKEIYTSIEQRFKKAKDWDDNFNKSREDFRNWRKSYNSGSNSRSKTNWDDIFGKAYGSSDPMEKIRVSADFFKFDPSKMKTKAEVKKFYRQWAVDTHPDKFQTADEAIRKAKEEAFKVGGGHWENISGSEWFSKLAGLRFYGNY